MAQAGPGRKRWASLRLPFEAGVADAGFLHLPPVVPERLALGGGFAFFQPVLDASGRLAAVTEGGLDRAQWTDMLAEAAQPAERWLDRALPFPGGRWSPGSPSPMSQHLLEDEAFHSAAEYLASPPRAALQAEFRGRLSAGGIRARSTRWPLIRRRRGREAEALATYRQVLSPSSGRMSLTAATTWRSR